MGDIQKMLYQCMRFNVMKTVLGNGSKNSPFSEAYVYAWYEGVYPLFSDGAEWHKPFGEQFEISEEQVDELYHFLDECWKAKKVVSFYGLEDHYDVHGLANSLGRWERDSLTRTCRYMYLEELFDKEFWRKLVENDCPCEAHSICEEFRPGDEIYFQ